MPILLAGLSALTWGISDFLGGMVTRQVRATVVVLWSQVAGLGLGLVAAPLFGGPGLTREVVLWGAAAGMAGSFGLVSLYQGLATGSMSVVAPVSAVVASAIPIAAGLAAGERPDAAAWVGIFVALPAIWLVSRQTTGEWGAGLGLGLAAGAGFGLFFVFLSYAPAETGLWPLVPARVASILVLSALVALRRQPLSVNRRATGGVVAVGLGDMTANMLFLAAVQIGMLSLVAVVSSLYPVFTVLLARAVLAEAIGLRRWAGIGLAVVALALISV